MNKVNVNKSTKEMVITALFAAIIIVMASVPYLGYIPLGVMNATIIHIPVIIGAIILGPKKGAFLGGVFGLTSLLKSTFEPTATSFVFSPFYSVGEMHGNAASILISMGPRILIGVVAYYVFKAICKLLKNIKGNKVIAYAVAGVAGSLTNTLLVMGGIYIFFGNNYAAVRGIAVDTLFRVIIIFIGTQGVPEAIVAGVLVTAICKVLNSGAITKS